jgi:hypothetical protein
MQWRVVCIAITTPVSVLPLEIWVRFSCGQFDVSGRAENRNSNTAPLTVQPLVSLVAFGSQAQDGTSKESFTLTLKPLLEIIHATTIGHLRWRYHRMF